jgi:hypothetical protein
MKQLYPGDQLPFKLKDLSYELVVTRVNLDCTLRLQVKPGTDKDQVIAVLGGFIEQYNLRSEKKAGQVGFFVSQRFINKVNETNCTGMLFTPINAVYP